MYELFLDKLSGRTFVGDFDAVRASLTMLNEDISRDGKINANKYYEYVGLRPLNPNVTYLVLKNVMFEFYPAKIGNVDVVAIDLETYSCLFDDEGEEVDYVQTVLRGDNEKVFCRG